MKTPRNMAMTLLERLYIVKITPVAECLFGLGIQHR